MDAATDVGCLSAGHDIMEWSIIGNCRSAERWMKPLLAQSVTGCYGRRSQPSTTTSNGDPLPDVKVTFCNAFSVGRRDQLVHHHSFLIKHAGWIRYDTIQDCNGDWKAECGQLNPADVNGRFNDRRRPGTVTVCTVSAPIHRVLLKFIQSRIKNDTVENCAD